MPVDVADGQTAVSEYRRTELVLRLLSVSFFLFPSIFFYVPVDTDSVWCRTCLSALPFSKAQCSKSGVRPEAPSPLIPELWFDFSNHLLLFGGTDCYEAGCSGEHTCASFRQ